jgi:hypothetical protein
VLYSCNGKICPCSLQKRKGRGKKELSETNDPNTNTFEIVGARTHFTFDTRNH